MARANKTYGFTIAVKELKETVPNIFRYASAYKRKHKMKSKGLWEMFLEPQPEEPKSLPKDDPKYQTPLPEEIMSTEPGHGRLPEIDPEAMEGETYNMCHFWSNFEIARLDWFRSQEYEDFFQMMDRSGGFWMERVSCLVMSSVCTRADRFSGEMHLSTHWQRVRCWDPRISTISVILVTGIPQFNIVLQTRRLVSFRERRIWRKQP